MFCLAAIFLLYDCFVKTLSKPWVRRKLHSHPITVQLNNLDHRNGLVNVLHTVLWLRETCFLITWIDLNCLLCVQYLKDWSALSQVARSWRSQLGDARASTNLYPLLFGQIMGFHLVVTGFPGVGVRSVGHGPGILRLSVWLVKSECSPTGWGSPNSRLRSADHVGHERSTRRMVIIVASPKQVRPLVTDHN